MSLAPLAWGSAAIVAFPWQTARGARPGADMTAEFLAGLVPDNEFSRHLAQSVDSRRHAGAVKRAVAEYLRSTGTPTAEGIRQMLTDRIRADFDQGRTVTTDGWRLSETEAGLIRLASTVKHR